jgi:hypothetical protein
MTQPESTFPPPIEDNPAPFASALSVPVDKPVNLGQLTDELSKATGHHVTLALTEADGAASLAVTPGNLNPAAVKKVLADHSPVTDYGVPEEEKVFAALQARVLTGPVELTDTEIQAAVVGLLRRSAAPSSRRR